MKIQIKIILFLILLCAELKVFANNDISQLATAFYSDNNCKKTLEYLMKIPETERTAQDWLLLGNIYGENKDNKKACLMYQKAINLKSDYYKAYYNLANTYFKQKSYYTAIKYYKNALKYNKTNPYIYYNCGCAYIKTCKLKKAEEMFTQAIIIQNNIPDFHYNMAYVCKRLNKPEKAQTYLDNYNKLLNNDNF